jgi:predicted glutamine amidotransferase
MCELFAMSSRLPATITYSLEEFAQHVVLAATVPLTDEPWEALDEGEIVVARNGEIVARVGS